MMRIVIQMRMEGYVVPHIDLDAWDWRGRGRGMCVLPVLAGQGLVRQPGEEDGNISEK